MFQKHFFVSVAFVICLGIATQSVSAQHDFSKNSTAKIRVKPSPLAARIGSAVEWRKDLETALEESQTTGKPVFWYVPTVRGTFMDRKDSIDRYMLAGPFSWPPIIEMLNQHFVPVKVNPKPAQQQKYEIRPYVFIEPGFAILNPTGDLVAKVDRLTTLHPQWLQHLIGSYLENVPTSRRSEKLERLWNQFAKGEYTQMAFPTSIAGDDAVELLLLQGMTEFRLGNHDSAKQKWELASKSNPDSPLAWKAAAEAEGFGPFVRGFEVFRELPPSAMGAGRESAGSAAPSQTYTEAELWDRGVQFLLDMQAPNGGWFDSDYDFGGTDSLPNVHVAVSAIAGMTLLDALSRPDITESWRAKVESALQKATTFLLDDRHLNRSDRDELAWAYAYRMRFFARLVKSKPEVLESLKANVKDLESMQMASGAWFHEYPNPMITALALLAFAESAEVGAAPQSETITRGVAALQRDRFGNGGFTYSSRGQSRAAAGGVAEIAQSAGRMPLCELGLWLHGASNDQRLDNAVEKSFELAKPMMDSLKYDNHTSNHAYGGFFIWYDIEARGDTILKLEDVSQKSRFQQMQRELILSLPEVDGCFVDSHELGRVYGTAMALISMAKTHR
jgi:hypothetical protein